MFPFEIYFLPYLEKIRIIVFFVKMLVNTEYLGETKKEGEDESRYIC